MSLPRPARSQPLHLVVDATGVKRYVDGEWQARRHGPGKRRTWRKLHLAVDESSGEAAASVTTNDAGDNEQLPDLLDAVDGEIAQFSGDGANDTRACYAAIAEHDASAMRTRALFAGTGGPDGSKPAATTDVAPWRPQCCG